MQVCEFHNKLYDEQKYKSCWECYQDFLKTLIECLYCEKLHSPSYPVCFACQQVKDRAKNATDLRLLIFSRDDFTCQHCRARDPDVNVDVILPHSMGGRTVQWNLGLLCAECNLEKGREYRPADQTRRNRLMDYYWTAGYQFLSPDEKNLLREDVHEREGLTVEEVDEAFRERRAEREETRRLREELGL